MEVPQVQLVERVVEVPQVQVQEMPRELPRIVSRERFAGMPGPMRKTTIVEELLPTPSYKDHENGA